MVSSWEAGVEINLDTLPHAKTPTPDGLQINRKDKTITEKTLTSGQMFLGHKKQGPIHRNYEIVKQRTTLKE